MCGIVGYVGARPALGIIIEGLRRLEYRGYDSAGVAIAGGSTLLTYKRAGKLSNLEKALAEAGGHRLAAGVDTGTTGIGHTRWATHGGPTDRNAHPHPSTNGRVAVIHNGIIENFARLRAELEATGVEFASETDTECVAHLLHAEITSLRAATGSPATTPARGSPARRTSAGGAAAARAQARRTVAARSGTRPIVTARTSPAAAGNGGKTTMPPTADGSGVRARGTRAGKNAAAGTAGKTAAGTAGKTAAGRTAAGRTAAGTAAAGDGGGGMATAGAAKNSRRAATAGNPSGRAVRAGGAARSGAARSGAVPADGARLLAEAMRRVCRRLEGAFTLLAIDADTPGVLVGARRNSPLVVGRGRRENFLASDVAAFIEHTRDAVELGQDQVVTITTEDIEITDFDGNPAQGKDFRIDWDATAAEKGGYDYFMLKEIAEQPRAVADALRGRLSETGELMLDETRLTDQDLRDVDKIFIIACGTAYHAGLVAKYAIEHWTRIPCEVELASEFRYRDPVLDRSTLVVAISQSGETMDTLMALRHAKEQKARVLAVCNTNGSTIPRESDAVLYTHAGPEIAVASTKAFLTQLVACYLVGLHLAQVRGIKYADEVGAVLDQLQAMPAAVDQVLQTMQPVRELARKLAESRSVLFIGRHVSYPVALEGALKLKELAYMHAEGFAAGELKHGPIALIEEGTPVVCVVPSWRGRGVLHDKILSNIQEVRARGARTIVIAEQGDEAVRGFADHLVEVPATPTLLAPLVTTVPLQVFACEVASARGHDVDQPRNLAKSVTVE